jgi:archaemetzincin
VVSVGGADGGLLEALGVELDRRLGTRSAPGEPLPLDAEWWDGERGRYRSGPIVDALLRRADGSADRREWWLGIVEGELCAPGYDLVFGEATVGGPCAVVGLGPLRARSADGEPRLWDRLVTEAIHELGHLAGADHCGDPDCVMYPSHDLADTDRKGNSYCGSCLRTVAEYGA